MSDSRPFKRKNNEDNIAYRQNAPGLEAARRNPVGGVEITPLTREGVAKRISKWEQYDELFRRLQEDSIALYSQFEINEHTVDAMSWPADSYAKTQIYKLDHFLWLYHEGRCRELVDLLKMLLALLRSICQEHWGEPSLLEPEPLD